MKESRAIQRASGQGQSTGAIMTPNGPAVIQVIDMNGGVLAPGGKAGAKSKVGGINIFSAILRRWWLVLLVTVLIGAAGIYAGSNFVKPVYEGDATVSCHDPNIGEHGVSPVAEIVRRARAVLKNGEIPLKVVRSDKGAELFPVLMQGRDLKDPAVQADFLHYFKNAGIVDSIEDKEALELLHVTAIDPNPATAQKMADAFAQAFVDYCIAQATTQNTEAIAVQKQLLEEDQYRLSVLRNRFKDLEKTNNHQLNVQLLETTAQQVAKLKEDEFRARVESAAAEENVIRISHAGQDIRPDQQLERLKFVEDEKSHDSVLKAFETEMLTALDKYNLERQEKKEDHPDVRTAKSAMERARKNMQDREVEITSVIDAKIKQRFNLTDQKDAYAAKQALEKARAQVKLLEEQMEKFQVEARKYADIKSQEDELQDNIKSVSERASVTQKMLDDVNLGILKDPVKSSFRIESLAELPQKPKADKRIKVQAAGVVGGLFLGILLALVIDRFDKRLRNFNDLEAMLEVPLLGTIPRIQELKKIKGDQARNLIAEEFRIIRTQVLFGNPDLQYKMIAITSPTPGDGKTSLAVNLAISIAKAGRRVLLIDADLRKPDVHRVFNIPDGQGFAELIAGSVEPGAVIRKSDIDGLDVLPAGTPITRPSELLSRPELQRLLDALSELYDHIILDTAPLLPVSDTHVLVGQVDGVIVSFNADVDRDSIKMSHDILIRSRAKIIGSVMNQVPYKQSGSYQRGKTSYESYYSSARGSPKSGPDGAIASINKQL